MTPTLSIMLLHYLFACGSVTALRADFRDAVDTKAFDTTMSSKNGWFAASEDVEKGEKGKYPQEWIDDCKKYSDNPLYKDKHHPLIGNYSIKRFFAQYNKDHTKLDLEDRGWVYDAGPFNGLVCNDTEPEPEDEKINDGTTLGSCNKKSLNKRVVLIRHGKTTANDHRAKEMIDEKLKDDTLTEAQKHKILEKYWKEIAECCYDTPLNADGEQQAKSIAELHLDLFAAGLETVKVWTSPMRRAVQTAQFSLPNRGIDLLVPEAREMFANDAGLGSPADTVESWLRDIDNKEWASTLGGQTPVDGKAYWDEVAASRKHINDNDRMERLHETVIQELFKEGSTTDTIFIFAHWGILYGYSELFSDFLHRDRCVYEQNDYLEGYTKGFKKVGKGSTYNGKFYAPKNGDFVTLEFRKRD